MTDTDMLYMATLEKRNAELEARISVLEDKHHNECGQVAHYSDENAKLKKLLRKAMEDIKDCIYYHIHCENCALYDSNGDCPVADNDECGEKCKWRYADEALTLIGGGENDT